MADMFKQLKLMNIIKNLVEDKFSNELVVRQDGFRIIIYPRNLEELTEIIRENVSKEKNLVFEYERERKLVEKELELEMEGY